MAFRVIYDFADDYPHFYSFIFFAVSLGCGWYSWRQIREERRKHPASYHAYTKESIVGPILAGCFCFLVGYETLKPGDYIQTKTIYKTGTFKKTTGYITSYTERHPGKHDVISFTLNGLKFEFANNTVWYGCGYSDISHARITDSALVSLFYFTDDGSHRVLRIERFK